MVLGKLDFPCKGTNGPLAYIFHITKLKERLKLKPLESTLGKPLDIDSLDSPLIANQEAFQRKGCNSRSNEMLKLDFTNLLLVMQKVIHANVDTNEIFSFTCLSASILIPLKNHFYTKAEQSVLP